MFTAKRTPVVLTAGGAIATITALALTGCSTGKSGDNADSKDKSSASTVNITMKNDGSGDNCTASTTKVNAGAVTFTVKNESATGIIEFELLQDQRIVGEKENLAPGLKPVSFTVTLDGGKYQLYCPGASKELQDFTVTGKAKKTSNSTTALLDEGAKGYGEYVQGRLSDLLDGSKKLQASIDAGNMEQAKKDYADTRQFYEKIESDVDSFIKPGAKATDNSGNLDYLIDMRASNIDDAVGWHGFHAIERDLWEGGKITDDTKKLAAELTENVQTLKDLSKDIAYKPEDLANGAAGLLEEVQTNKISGEEEAYSHIDLTDLASNVEGARQAFAYLKPGLEKIDKSLVADIEKQFKNVDSVLAEYRDANSLGGYKTYDESLKASAGNKVSQAVQALQDPLSKLAQKVTSAK